MPNRPIPGISLTRRLNDDPVGNAVREFSALAGMTDGGIGDPFDQPVTQQMQGPSPALQLRNFGADLVSEGFDPAEIIVAPPDASSQLRSMAIDLRRLGVPDKEILKSLKQARIKQVTSPRGGRDTYAVLSPEAIEGLNLPQGTVAQRNRVSGRIEIIRSPSTKKVSAREAVLRKMAEGKEIITPGEQDVLLLNIQDIIQRDDVSKAVARHNAQVRAQTTATTPVLPKNPALRVKGMKYRNPKDPNDILLWDGKQVVRE